MRFDFRGIDWAGKQKRFSFWLKDVYHITSENKIIIVSTLGREREYPFLKNYHNSGIKEFIHNCIRSNGYSVEKNVNGQVQEHNLYGSFKDFEILNPNTFRSYTLANKVDHDLLHIFKSPIGKQTDSNGNLVICNWDNLYIAQVAERIVIRNALIKKVECLKFDL